jgi:hypothetical protein
VRNTSSAFLMPDDNSSGSRKGGGYSFADSLAEKFDLGRHMMGSRSTTATEGRARQARAETGTTAQTSSAGQGGGGLVSGGASLLRGAAQGAENASAASQQSLAPSSVPVAAGENARSQVFAAKSLEMRDVRGGTNAATQAGGDMYSGDNSRIVVADLRSLSFSQFGLMRGQIVMSAASGDGRGRDKGREDPQYSSVEQVVRTTGSPADTAPAGGDVLETPRMHEVSKSVMEQMERMRTDPNGGSAGMQLELPDGSVLDMTLRWRGNHVRVRFGAGAAKMRSEIENGWASLTRGAGNAGMNLDIPTFDEDASFGDNFNNK